MGQYAADDDGPHHNGRGVMVETDARVIVTPTVREVIDALMVRGKLTRDSDGGLKIVPTDLDSVLAILDELGRALDGDGEAPREEGRERSWSYAS